MFLPGRKLVVFNIKKALALHYGNGRRGLSQEHQRRNDVSVFLKGAHQHVHEFIEYCDIRWDVPCVIFAQRNQRIQSPDDMPAVEWSIRRHPPSVVLPEIKTCACSDFSGQRVGALVRRMDAACDTKYYTRSDF